MTYLKKDLEKDIQGELNFLMDLLGHTSKNNSEILKYNFNLWFNTIIYEIMYVLKKDMEDINFGSNVEKAYNKVENILEKNKDYKGKFSKIRHQHKLFIHPKQFPEFMELFNLYNLDDILIINEEDGIENKKLSNYNELFELFNSKYYGLYFALTTTMYASQINNKDYVNNDYFVLKNLSKGFRINCNFDKSVFKSRLVKNKKNKKSINTNYNIDYPSKIVGIDSKNKICLFVNDLSNVEYKLYLFAILFRFEYLSFLLSTVMNTDMEYDLVKYYYKYIIINYYLCVESLKELTNKLKIFDKNVDLNLTDFTSKLNNYTQDEKLLKKIRNTIHKKSLVNKKDYKIFDDFLVDMKDLNKTTEKLDLNKEYGIIKIPRTGVEFLLDKKTTINVELTTEELTLNYLKNIKDSLNVIEDYITTLYNNIQ